MMSWGDSTELVVTAVKGMEKIEYTVEGVDGVGDALTKPSSSRSFRQSLRSVQWCFTVNTYLYQSMDGSKHCQSTRS